MRYYDISSELIFLNRSAANFSFLLPLIYLSLSSQFGTNNLATGSIDHNTLAPAVAIGFCQENQLAPVAPIRL